MTVVGNRHVPYVVFGNINLSNVQAQSAHNGYEICFGQMSDSEEVVIKDRIAQTYMAEKIEAVQ